MMKLLMVLFVCKIFDYEEFRAHALAALLDTSLRSDLATYSLFFLDFSTVRVGVCIVNGLR